MHRFFCMLILIFFLFGSASCFSQYRSKPIGISKRKYNQIRARRLVKRERAYIPKYSRTQAYTRQAYKHRRARYINANAINRRRNQHAIFKKRREDNSYREYRDYVESSRKSEKSNFSIYDK